MILSSVGYTEEPKTMLLEKDGEIIRVPAPPEYEEVGIDHDPHTILLSKDGKIIRVPAPPDREYEDATENYKFADPEGYQKLKDELKAYRESQGLPSGPAIYVPKQRKKDPNEVKIFELSPDESIPGCHYAAGYSFPSRCYYEEPGGPLSKELIFRAGIDPQSVLDALKEKYGITGEHNVVPEGYTADVLNDEGAENTAATESSPISNELTNP